MSNVTTLASMLEMYRDMKAELQPQIDALKQIENAIKTHVRDTGEVATGDGASVKIRKGSTRTSWDSKGLKGYAVANPDILQFMTEKRSADVVTIKVG